MREYGHGLMLLATVYARQPGWCADLVKATCLLRYDDRLGHVFDGYGCQGWLDYMIFQNCVYCHGLCSLFLFTSYLNVTICMILSNCKGTVGKRRPDVHGTDFKRIISI